MLDIYIYIHYNLTMQRFPLKKDFPLTKGVKNMKKLLSLALVLVFALSLAAPALAYTDVTDAGASPFSIDIYLVDYSSSLGLFNSVALSLPATNRAYGVNEVVAAVASFTVPANTNILSHYGKVVFSANNVSMAVADNRYVSGGTTVTGFTNDVVRTVVGTTTANTLSASPFATPASAVLVDAEEVELSFDTPGAVLQQSTKAQKYSFLIYGKVLDDDAEMSVELQRGATMAATSTWGTVATRLRAKNTAVTVADYQALFTTATNATFNNFVVLNDDYIVFTSAGNDTERVYAVTNNAATLSDAKALLLIEVNAKNETTGVVYYDGTNPYRFYMYAGGDVGINRVDGGLFAPVASDETLYASLLAGFERLFDKLDLTLSNRTNIMKHSFWTGKANATNLKETISIDPLALPYIQVPEVEVTEPPKTGSAASILGFVIIAMAGLAAVVVRKVRA